MINRFAVVVLTSLLLICTSHGASTLAREQTTADQKFKGAAQGIPKEASPPIRAAQAAIQLAQPSIEEATIDRDKEALGRAYTLVWTEGEHSEGTESNTGRLLAAVWRDYRISHPNAYFNAAKIEELAGGYGGLHVVSSPTKATVSVDGIRWDSPTETTNFTSAGNREVRVGKDGYKDSVSEIKIVASKIIDYRVILKRK